MLMSTGKFTTVSTTFALVAGVALALSGCSGGPLDGPTQGGANGTVENSTEADGPVEGSSGADEGNAKDDSEGGEGTGGFVIGSIPEDFPSQIPVADGEVTGGLSGTVEGDTMWSFSVRSKDSSAFDKLRSQLNSSGFTEDDVMEGDTTMGWWQGHGYDVFITSSEDGGATNIAYIVTMTED